MFYIANTIPYVNGEPHLGHLHEALFSDVVARFQRRVLTEKVTFSMGLDQHGLKIYQKSRDLNLPVEEYVKLESQKFIELWKRFEISNDVFVQTSHPNHKIIARMVWEMLLRKKLIYEKSYTGLYCVGCEAFYSKSQLLEDGTCPIHLTHPIELSEKNYFYKLSKFSQEIKDYLLSGDIQPRQITKEWLNFIDEGLEDISISREIKNLPHGIPVPGDDQQVMYVWFEALLNYLTAVVDPELFDKHREFPVLKNEVESEIFQNIKENFPVSLQYIGKDMSKFHLIIWPAILIGLGLELTKKTLVHGFINDRHGKKMSKSLNNGISPSELIEIFGIEGTRFVMAFEVNNFEDTNFDIKACIESYNVNLADKLGNLLMRVTTLTEKFLDGEILLQTENQTETGVSLKKFYALIAENEVQTAIKELFKEISKLNEYLEKTKPWSLGKNLSQNLPRIAEILSNCCLDLGEINKALSLYMPQTAETISEILNPEKIVKAPVLFPKIEVK